MKFTPTIPPQKQPTIDYISEDGKIQLIKRDCAENGTIYTAVIHLSNDGTVIIARSGATPAAALDRLKATAARLSCELRDIAACCCGDVTVSDELHERVEQ